MAKRRGYWKERNPHCAFTDSLGRLQLQGSPSWIMFLCITGFLFSAIAFRCFLAASVLLSRCRTPEASSVGSLTLCKITRCLRLSQTASFQLQNAPTKLVPKALCQAPLGERAGNSVATDPLAEKKSQMKSSRRGRGGLLRGVRCQACVHHHVEKCRMIH